MKKLCILIVFVFFTGFAFADTGEKVASDAESFLTSQQEKSADYHLFLDQNPLDSLGNREKLNDFRKRFNVVTGKIYVLKNQISVEQKSRSPNLRALAEHRNNLEVLVDEHDKLLSEYQKWVASL